MGNALSSLRIYTEPHPVTSRCELAFRIHLQSRDGGSCDRCTAKNDAMFIHTEMVVPSIASRMKEICQLLRVWIDGLKVIALTKIAGPAGKR